MSSQPISRAAVQGLAGGAFLYVVLCTAVGVAIAGDGLGHMGSMRTVGSLLLCVVIVVVTGILADTSIRLRRAARRLPPKSLSPEAEAQEKRISRRSTFVSVFEAFLLVGLTLGSPHAELVAPVVVLIFGITFLLIALLRIPARYMPVSFYYLTGGPLTLLGGVAVLALLLGATPGGVYIWTVIVGLGWIVIFWLSVLYLLYGGRRLLRQGTQ